MMLRQVFVTVFNAVLIPLVISEIRLNMLHFHSVRERLWCKDVKTDDYNATERVRSKAL